MTAQGTKGFHEGDRDMTTETTMYAANLQALRIAARNSRDEFYGIHKEYPNRSRDDGNRFWVRDFGRTYPASLYVTTQAFDEAWEVWHDIFGGQA